MSNLKQHGVEQSGSYVKFNYYLADGSLAPRLRLRRALEGKKRFLWNKSPGQIVPYGLSHLNDARAAGVVYFVEGETDTLTLWLHGYPAIGMPGADTSNLIRSRYLERISTVYIVREPDEGVAIVAAMCLRLAEIEFAGSVRVLVMPQEFKDPNAFHVRWLRDRGAFEANIDELSRVAETIDLTALSLSEKYKASGSEGQSPEFSDDGIALRFAVEHVDDLRYVAAWNRWLGWDHGRRGADTTTLLHAVDEVRKVCRRTAASARLRLLEIRQKPKNSLRQSGQAKP